MKRLSLKSQCCLKSAVWKLRCSGSISKIFGAWLSAQTSLKAHINTFCSGAFWSQLMSTCLFPATRSLSQLQRVHGRVWAALQDGPRIPESANRDCPAHPEKVSLAAKFHLFRSFCASKCLIWYWCNSVHLFVKGRVSYYACVASSSTNKRGVQKDIYRQQANLADKSKATDT